MLTAMYRAYCTRGEAFWNIFSRQTWYTGVYQMQIWTIQLIFSRIYSLVDIWLKITRYLVVFLAKLRTFIVLDTDVKRNNYIHSIWMILYIKTDVKRTYSMMIMASVFMVIIAIDVWQLINNIMKGLCRIFAHLFIYFLISIRFEISRFKIRT